MFKIITATVALLGLTTATVLSILSATEYLELRGGSAAAGVGAGMLWLLEKKLAPTS